MLIYTKITNNTNTVYTNNNPKETLLGTSLLRSGLNPETLGL